jgi:hypothetical protein
MNAIARTMLITMLLIGGYATMAFSSEPVITLPERLGVTDEAGTAKGIQFEAADKSEFTPTLKIGMGMVLESLYQTVDDDLYHKGSYNFQPGALKLGYVHFDASLTSKLSASLSLSVHTPKVSDAFVKYDFSKYLNVQAGRFKGAGTRAAHETSAYDLDLVDFTYYSENQSTDVGAPDLRHMGLQIGGRYEWVKYAFFLHNNNYDRSRYWAAMNDGIQSGNHSLDFKNWDVSLRFFPTTNVEFGGHFGSVNMPGTGDKTTYSHSAFAYYVAPNKFKVKLDYGGHTKTMYKSPLTAADNEIYTLSENYIGGVEKMGISCLAAFNITDKIEPAIRYEHVDQGDIELNGLGYKKLNLLTVGVNYYLFPKSPRMAKLTAFYHHRGESGGINIKNDWFGLSYQIVLYK